MKTKSEQPIVTQSIKVTLEGRTFELSKQEATALFQALKKELNIPDLIQWLPSPSPVVIERPIYERPHWQPATPYSPPWNDPNRITCIGSDQAELGTNTGRIFNLSQ